MRHESHTQGERRRDRRCSAYRDTKQARAHAPLRSAPLRRSLYRFGEPTRPDVTRRERSTKNNNVRSPFRLSIESSSDVLNNGRSSSIVFAVAVGVVVVVVALLTSTVASNCSTNRNNILNQIARPPALTKLSKKESLIEPRCNDRQAVGMSRRSELQRKTTCVS